MKPLPNYLFRWCCNFEIMGCIASCWYKPKPPLEFVFLLFLASVFWTLKDVTDGE